MYPERSLPYPQNPVTNAYDEAQESGHHIQMLFIYYLPSI
jgi:hypothetical protein